MRHFHELINYSEIKVRFNFCQSFSVFTIYIVYITVTVLTYTVCSLKKKANVPHLVHFDIEG